MVRTTYEEILYSETELVTIGSRDGGLSPLRMFGQAAYSDTTDTYMSNPKK
jgi:hypothetical protein